MSKISPTVARVLEGIERAGVEWGWLHPSAVPTGLFIREYLRVKKRAYPFEIYRALREVRKGAGKRPPSARSFYLMFYMAEKLGLVEYVASEPAVGPGGQRLPLEKRYYRLAKDAYDNPCWFNIQKCYSQATKV